MRAPLLIAAIAVALSVSSVAHAQYDEFAADAHDVGSPQYLALELRLGPYTPNTGAAFDSTFGGDDGLLLATEIDVLFLRVPEVLSFGVGVGAGWADYSAKARSGTGTNESTEETSLTIWPLSAMGVLRLDVLPRKLDLPILFAAKLGLDFIPWSSGTGDTTEGSGISIGLRWAVQAALELDFFEPRAARALDEQWGINHTFILFELFGSSADSSIPLGTDLAWALGLGFNM